MRLLTRAGHIDVIFDTRLFQEKCIEQHRNQLLSFVDLHKAFDLVSRELLWEILAKFGCPSRFTIRLSPWSFHSGRSTRVALSGELSESFIANVRVKLGSVLAPGIFNIFTVHPCFPVRGLCWRWHTCSYDTGWMIIYLTWAACAQWLKHPWTQSLTCNMLKMQHSLAIV